MAFDRKSLDDYVDVATRIAEFRDKYPDGCLQPLNPAQPYRVEILGDETYIVVTAAAYREPNDPRPGVGSAWELWPGRTPYTKNSELMNAETSAWGRAIIAVLAADARRGVASQEEVRNRTAEREVKDTPTPEQAALFNEIVESIAKAGEVNMLGGIWFDINAHVKSGRLTEDQGHRLRARWTARKAKVEAS